MDERPEACPACRGTVLIRSGHACGRQRWKCKGPGCGRQFTRTTPRGTPGEVKRHAIELYCLGLSMNAVAKRVGVSAQSMLRWVRDHAHAHCPKPEPARGGTAVVEIDEVWHFVKKSPASSGSGRPSWDGPADRWGVRRPRPRHAGSLAQAPGALGRAPVLHRRLRALRGGPASRAALHRQGSDATQREQQLTPAALVGPFPAAHVRGLPLGRDGRRHHGAVRLLPLQRR